MRDSRETVSGKPCRTELTTKRSPSSTFAALGCVLKHSSGDASCSRLLCHSSDHSTVNARTTLSVAPLARVDRDGRVCFFGDCACDAARPALVRALSFLGVRVRV